ncbi:hypothetical protein RHGRI_005178 [Rhododendron griersonianum]|uniref:BED-type domain-containing protein n=1 Tax=Rhododendron griersonianum TaxID=479676 RepID=A0AAV6LDF8_9ERIC|nr:hypothetical protein RHGRI_005178 [Rhododendron griersonianum]
MAPPKKKSKNAVDLTWNHCVRATELTDPEDIDNTRLKLVCNYCGKTLSGGVSRMKHHLARTHHNAKPCEKAPEDVTNMFLKILGELKQRNCIEQDDVDCFDEVENVISKRGSMDQYVSKTKAKQVTLPSMLKDRTKPCVDICRMIYAKALPFSLVKSSWFHTAVQSIGEYGKGLKPPSYHEVKVTFLKKEVDNVHSTLDKYKMLDAKFWNAIRYCLKGVLPLVKALRLVDGDAKPAMSYIYEAMDRAKEQIDKNFNKVKRRYAAIWKIVDERWALQLHRPLHAAAYFLNPKFHYDASFEEDEEVRLGLYMVIERMYPGIQARLKLDAQMDKFHNAVGLWWESYGGSCKELQELATRVLSLTCSATGCGRNWSTLQHIHSKKRNQLEAQRLNALVVKYNLTLELRQKKREENGDPYDPICLSDMESDDEWITKREDPCLPLDPSWMDMNECFEVNEGETSRKGRRGPRNLQNDRKGKRKFVGEENEVEIIDDDVEEEIEEEEYIGDDGVVLRDDLEDDDDLYDIAMREE